MSHTHETEENPKCPEESPLEAWQRFHRESGAADFWDNVECIECELGRRCDEHRERCPTCHGEGSIPKATPPRPARSIYDERLCSDPTCLKGRCYPEKTCQDHRKRA